MDNYSISALILGIVGTITGITSLVWQICKNRFKLEIVVNPARFIWCSDYAACMDGTSTAHSKWMRLVNRSALSITIYEIEVFVPCELNGKFKCKYSIKPQCKLPCNPPCNGRDQFLQCKLPFKLPFNSKCMKSSHPDCTFPRLTSNAGITRGEPFNYNCPYIMNAVSGESLSYDDWEKKYDIKKINDQDSYAENNDEMEPMVFSDAKLPLLLKPYESFEGYVFFRGLGELLPESKVKIVFHTSRKTESIITNICYSEGDI